MRIAPILILRHSSTFSSESRPPITFEWNGGHNNEQYLSPVGISISDRTLNLPYHWTNFSVRSHNFPVHHLHMSAGVRRDLLVADRFRCLRTRATRFSRIWGAKHRRVARQLDILIENLRVISLSR